MARAWPIAAAAASPAAVVHWSGEPPRPRSAPRRPGRSALLLLAAGVSLLIAAVLVLLLGLAGVDRVNEVLFVVVLVVAALLGGSLVRLLAPRLPAVRRPPKS
jgi:hypothetical protein